jgi:hypothetical protein
MKIDFFSGLLLGVFFSAVIMVAIWKLAIVVFWVALYGMFFIIFVVLGLVLLGAIKRTFFS